MSITSLYAERNNRISFNYNGQEQHIIFKYIFDTELFVQSIFKFYLDNISYIDSGILLDEESNFVALLDDHIQNKKEFYISHGLSVVHITEKEIVKNLKKIYEFC